MVVVVLTITMVWMLRIVTYYKYENCILWKISTGPFLDTYRVRIWNWGREGGREEGYRFIKILTFWFLSTKHTKHINSSMEKTILTYRAQKEKSQYYSLNLEEKMQFTGCIVFLFSFLFFKGERHLFSWQRQYSMD